MSVDRLAEVQASPRSANNHDDIKSYEVNLTIGDDDVAITSADSDVVEHMSRYEPIRRALELIKSNGTTTESLRERFKNTADETSRSDIVQRVEAMMVETTRLARTVKQTLDSINADNVAYSAANSTSTARIQIRQNLYAAHVRRFQQVITQTNTAASSFKSVVHTTMKRQVILIDPTLSDAQVDEIVESGNAGTIVRDALISDQLTSAIQIIEERHLEIRNIEQQVRNILDLFSDLALIVDQQQEILNVIDTHVQRTQRYVKRAEEDLNMTVIYKRRARGRQWCICILCVIIVAVILIPILIIDFYVNTTNNNTP